MPIHLQEAAAILARVNNLTLDGMTTAKGRNIPKIFQTENLLDDTTIYYAPKAYTFDEVKQFASPDMIRLFDFLEAFPECGSKPIFDQFRVVVPSFTRVSPDKRGSYNDTADKKILKDKSAISVIVGERDGTHYFIGYWT
jgi:hypothetical protein